MLIYLPDYIKRESILSKPYKGVVVDNLDPKKLKRVKIKIEGLLEGSVDKLPWVTLKNQVKLGGSANDFFVPDTNTEVIVEFPYDDIYFPVCTGYWYSDKTRASDFENDYPNKYGFVDGGFKFIVDRSSGSLTIQTPSGAVVEIGNEGISASAESFNLEFDEYNLSAATTNIESDEVNIEGQQVSIDGQIVELGGGGLPIARVGDQAIGIGVFGVIVTSNIVVGSPKVTSG